MTTLHYLVHYTILGIYMQGRTVVDASKWWLLGARQWPALGLIFFIGLRDSDSIFFLANKLHS